MNLRRCCSRLSLPVVAALAVAAPAAAYICHPDARGTRTLVVHGSVAGYSLRDGNVTVAYRDLQNCAHVTVWRSFRGPAMRDAPTGGHCLARGAGLGADVLVPATPARVLRANGGGLRAVLRDNSSLAVYRGSRLVRLIPRAAHDPALRIAITHDHVVVLTRGDVRADRPDRAEVYNVASGKLLHAWPLLARPATFDLGRGIAIFSLRGNGGLYAIRLSDGRTTFIAPLQPGDTPQIGAQGVVYQSNLYLRLNRLHEISLKLVPTRAVLRDFAKTVDTLHTRWPVTSFSMDGPRVAVALDAPAGACDQVRFWNIPWHYFIRVSMQDEPTCDDGPGLAIRSVALAGISAEWVATGHGVTRVAGSNSSRCIEQLLATPDGASGVRLAGDGRLLGFADSSTVGRVHIVGRSGFTPSPLIHSPASLAALSVDGGRLAALRGDGVVDVIAADGRLVVRLRPTAPRAIALRGDRLAVLSADSTVEVWSTATGTLRHVWRVPAGMSPALDVHFGVAVLTRGGTVYALALQNGRLTTLARAVRHVRAQIESSGVVYQYNGARGGELRFVPMSVVEAKLGLA
jgi:hypothetical protein